jgi:hypothetical protein
MHQWNVKYSVIPGFEFYYIPMQYNKIYDISIKLQKTTFRSHEYKISYTKKLQTGRSILPVTSQT